MNPEGFTLTVYCTVCFTFVHVYCTQVKGPISKCEHIKICKKQIKVSACIDTSAECGYSDLFTKFGWTDPLRIVHSVGIMPLKSGNMVRQVQ